MSNEQRGLENFGDDWIMSNEGKEETTNKLPLLKNVCKVAVNPWRLYNRLVQGSKIIVIGYT